VAYVLGKVAVSVRIMSRRLGAFFFHLLISALAATALFVLVWYVLYPSPMLIAIGGHEIFFLLVTIDVIVGPLLTLAVFDEAKANLKLDLAVIATLQLCAMFYGLAKLVEARPVYVAALGDKFQVIQAPEIAASNLEKSNSVLPLFGPKWVGTRAPTSRIELDEVKSIVEMADGGLGHFPQYHIDYQEMRMLVIASGKTINELKRLNPELVSEIDSWLETHGVVSGNVLYQPIQIAATDYAVIFDAKTAFVVGVAPFKPWLR
jgi:hypothetical protein